MKVFSIISDHCEYYECQKSQILKTNFRKSYIIESLCHDGNNECWIKKTSTLMIKTSANRINYLQV